MFGPVGIERESLGGMLSQLRALGQGPIVKPRKLYEFLV